MDVAMTQMSKREQKKVIKDFVEQKIKQVKELNKKIVKEKNFY